ncbi:tripartite tricarboxylate transporter substrate binding protein [Sediminicoccus sp. KRV36]|uniref:Bug family tripartite tricarboxylate transporter substrate binding protein n=1 Tax=Sediminicoccus sp. KRV36 TaxID=3133721 RepID=UPI00200F3A68|nr:tripartite tricarboxylate transporter substrate binding protein [Sediminicoccus rosea]UPY37881.1 tripartite tricarboxylate transporter substrate binding protein [Sediminicoccus rosea]
MVLLRRLACWGGYLALGLLMAAPAAHAQATASADGREAIRLLIGLPPGSGVDQVARIFAEALGQRLFRPVLAENRTGARGNVAAEEVARALPDGNTLGFVTSTTLLLSRHLSRQMGYDPQADLTPISRFASLPMLVLGPPGQGVRTLAELTEVLRARPGTCGTPGAGTAQHLALELLIRSVGARCDFVHFRGLAGALPELLNGSVQVYVEAAVIGLPLMREGRVRLLAVTSRTRSALLPETPTVAETVPGFEAETWMALMGPRGLPDSVLAKLEAAAIAVARDTVVVQRLRALSAEPIGGTRSELAATIRAQDSIWGPVARAAGLTTD